MLKNKKGVELTVNTMIVIIITLLILVVLVFLVWKGAGNWNKGTECSTQGGDCRTTCNDEYPLVSAYSCSDKNEVCCIKFGGIGQT